MTISRRSLIKTASALLPAGAVFGSAPWVVGQTRHKLVVVGGGFAGATAARYAARWGGSNLDITLVDPKASHTSCVMSNLILNGQQTVDRLSFDLAGLGPQYGINVVQAYAQAVDGANKTLTLDSGEVLNYDSLIVSGGIDFVTDSFSQYDASLTPHAWIAGDQTLLLQEQLNAMDDYGTVVLSIPKAPYRCPPGPYERACIMANILGQRTGTLGPKRAGVNAPRVVVLDANADIIVEKETFGGAFEQLYGNIIEYYPNSEVTDVASDAGGTVVTTASGSSSWTLRPGQDVANIIPNQRAVPLLMSSGLTGAGSWAPINPLSYESTVAGFDDVYVIGDAQATGQPKSGHMANSQAKVCVDAILRKQQSMALDDPQRLKALVTNSACFSPVSDSEASWLTAVFAYDQAAGAMALVPESFGASTGWSSRNYQRMFGWSNNLLADTFL